MAMTGDPEKEDPNRSRNFRLPFFDLRSMLSSRTDTAIAVIDYVLSVLILSLLWPLFLLIGALILMDSPGPFFFRQKRAGQKGAVFVIYKFRSMRERPQQESHTYRKNSRNRIEPVIKTKNDTRVTVVGGFLRKFSLDELPQIINVIKGEMSLVGPRPPVLEEFNGYSPLQKERLDGKPGLTGLAQVNGRSDIDFDTIVEFDRFFNKNRSVWLYLKILILTVPCFMSGKSAF